MERTAPELKDFFPNLEERDPGTSSGAGIPVSLACTKDLATAIARPGTHAPHIHVDAAGKTDIPIADLFDGNFVLLLGEDGLDWEEAHKTLVEDKELPPIFSLRVRGSGFQSRYAISNAGVVLARPDGFVARKSGNGAKPGPDRRARLFVFQTPPQHELQNPLLP